MTEKELNDMTATVRLAAKVRMYRLDGKVDLYVGRPHGENCLHCILYRYTWVREFKGA